MLRLWRELTDSLTTRGAAFSAAGVVLALSGLSLGQRDLTRAGLLVLALVAASLWLLRQPRGSVLEVSRTADPPTAAIDEQVEVTVTLSNSGSRTTAVTSADETLDYRLADRPRFMVPALAPGSACQARYIVRPPVRGRHVLGPMVTRSVDVFGLATRGRALEGTQSVIVLPRIIGLTGVPEGAVGLGTYGDGTTTLALHGEDDQGIREYRSGDEMRRIHWPASARTGALMVRHEDRPLRRQAMVIVDTCASGHTTSGPTSTFEWCIAMGASVLAHLSGLRYDIVLLTASMDRAEHTAVDTDVDEGLRTLACASVTPPGSLAATLHGARGVQQSGGLVVVIAGTMSDRDAHSVAALRQPGSTGVAFLAGPGAGRAPVLAGAGAATIEAAGFRCIAVSGVTDHAVAWARASTSTVGRSR